MKNKDKNKMKKKDKNKMKKKDKKEYIKSPNHCPFCKGENIFTWNYDLSDEVAWSEVICMTCKKEWREYYTVTDIEEIV